MKFKTNSDTIDRFPDPLTFYHDRWMRTENKSRSNLYSGSSNVCDIVPNPCPYADDDLLLEEAVSLYLMHSLKSERSRQTLSHDDALFSVLIRRNPGITLKEVCSKEWYEAYFNALVVRGVRIASLNTYTSVFVRLEKFAFVNGLVDWLPRVASHRAYSSDVNTKSTVHHIWTEQEIEDLMFNCRWLSDRKRREIWPAIIKIGWATGMRCGDIFTLRKDSMDWAESVITYNSAKTFRASYSKPAISIPIGIDVMQGIKAVMDHDPTIPYLFPLFERLYGTDSGRTTLRYDWHTIRRAAGYRGHGYGLHSLRHSFFTRLARRNVNPILIASMAGVRLERVMTYVTNTTEDKRKALKL